MMPVFFLKTSEAKTVGLDIYRAHITEKISSFGFKIIVFFFIYFLKLFFSIDISSILY